MPYPRCTVLTALAALVLAASAADAGFVFVNSPTQLTATDTISWGQLYTGGPLTLPATLQSANGVNVTLEQSWSSRFGGSAALEVGLSHDASIWDLVSSSFGYTSSTLDIKLSSPVQAFGMQLDAATLLAADPLSREVVTLQALDAKGSVLPGSSFGPYQDINSYAGIASDRANIYGVELVMQEFTTEQDTLGETVIHNIDLAGRPTVTPEPSSLVLLVLGGGSTLVYARRRMRVMSRR